MKKHTWIFIFLSFFSFAAIAQESNVEWFSSLEKNNASEYTLTLKAELKEGWHLYSQQLPEGGPLPTVFTFENQENLYQLIGKTEESETHSSYEEIFKMETFYFEDVAIFKQKIKVLSEELSQLKILASYQTCNDEACTFEPGEEILVSLNGPQLVANEIKIIDKRSKTLSNQLDLKLKNRKTYFPDSKDTAQEEKGLGTIFLLGFFGGLIALFTPCVFPMIPLTVSFFTKKTNTKSKGVSNALLYGFFITFIYLLLSLPFHFLDSLDPEILNSISTNVWLNVSFFVIFILFAISFFGYFEITLPHAWSNKMDAASDIGGIIGTFFMALTLAIVSFSCTGPILGSLLVGALSSDGGAMQLTFGMLGFGAALALPFTLFALFPNWLNNLPKSGGWLNTVKVVLGFLEVALALKFLSNADMVL